MSESKTLSRKKKILFLSIIYLVLLSAGILLLALAMFILRTKTLYDHHKGKELIIKDRIFQYDPELGLAPLPNSESKWVYPDGSEIPLRFDQYGFRVPENAPTQTTLTHPLILVLGCSYSFGSGIRAEETYCYLVGEKTHSQCLNAAYPSFGLAQMLVLAQRLVPRFQPDLLIVQYSPWLVDRSQNPFSWHTLLITDPFFVSSSAGKLSIHPPLFKPASFEIDLHQYHYTARSLIDYLSFLKRICLPLLVRDGWKVESYRLKRWLGMTPAVEQSSEKIVEFAYQEIARLAKENQAQMMILILTDPGMYRRASSAEIEKIQRIPGVIIVNPFPALWRALPEKSLKAYDRTFRSFYKSSSKLKDTHPNPLAHQIIAEEIIKSIEKYHLLPGSQTE